MATYTCYWLIMGKMKIGFYCYLITDILIKRLQKCSLSNPLWSIWILSKLLNLIGCHGNQRAKFMKKYKKNISSEVLTGMKLKLCRNVHNISLYKNYVFNCCCSCAYVSMTIKFPLTYNGKSKSRPLLLSHCRYFDKSFTEMFLEYQIYEFCQNCWIWLVAMATESINSWKKKEKNHLLRSHNGDETETVEIFITLASTKNMFFIAVAHVLSCLWQLKVSIDL